MEINRSKRKIETDEESLKIPKLELINNLWDIRDLVEHILQFLSIVDLLDLNLVSKMWKQILDKESFWEKKVFNDYPQLNLISCKSNISWKNWSKGRFSKTEYKQSILTLRNHLGLNDIFTEKTDLLIKDCFQKQKIYEKSNYPITQCVDDEDIKYRDFILFGTILKLSKNNSWFDNELYILSLSGKQHKFKFNCYEANRYDHDNNDVQIFEKLILKYGEDEMKIIGKDSIYKKHKDVIYKILEFPKTFSFKIFVKQIYNICTNKNFRV